MPPRPVPTVPPAELLSRLRAGGPRALDDREALQVAGRLTARQAAVLLDEFGSLPEALAATPGELSRCVRSPAAARLSLLKDVSRRLLEAPLRQRRPLGGWDAVADYLRLVLRGLPREQLRALFLDRRNRMIRDEIMGEGTVDHVPVYPRELLRRALELNASALVLAHNHPGGLTTPSPADVEVTKQVVEAGRVLRVRLHDHFLVADGTVVSFRSLGLL